MAAVIYIWFLFLLLCSVLVAFVTHCWLFDCLLGFHNDFTRSLFQNWSVIV